MIRQEVYYQGHVQGVGFRATVRQIAGRYDVAGYVRNLPDGRVELIAEGERDEVESMLREVSREMSGFIRDTAVHEAAASKQFGEFSIRY